MTNETMKIWRELEPMIENLITERTRANVRRRKMTVTTAYTAETGRIGVTEAFGQEIFIPASAAAQTVPEGQSVWVESWFGKANAVAMYPGNIV